MNARFELPMTDPAYPSLLRETPDPPRTLYGIGDPRALGDALAVIGARRATPYGIAMTRLFTSWAASAGYRIVSGGALGCDSAAHYAAIEAGGTTVAVMGGAVDVPYPRSNKVLFERIADTGGAVISEQPWGTEPLPWMFRRRNRIIAGLSQAVLVIEAGLPSGTFSTADDALSAGRSVLAVPGSALSPESRGSNRLIRQGATPISDVSDLRDELTALLGAPDRDHPLEAVLSPSDDPLLRALLADPMRPDDAARSLGVDIVTISRRLGALEAEGLIKRYQDGRYGPCDGATVQCVRPGW